MKKNIFIINGPNLNLLGSREPSVYGHLTLDEINLQLQQKIASVNFSFFQSNNESELIEIIHRANQNANAVVLNAGGFSHTSIALADAVASISIPIFSVHISNIFNREKYRHQDIVGEKCKGSIIGLGTVGYELAVQCLLEDFLK